jgi:hypothetical protein
MTSQVEARRRFRDGDEQIKVAEAVFTFVAIDSGSRPHPLPPGSARSAPGSIASDRAEHIGHRITALPRVCGAHYCSVNFALSSVKHPSPGSKRSRTLSHRDGPYC